MTLGLVTRGYIERRGTGVGGAVFGKGPTIVSTESVTPTVSGSASIKPSGPSFVGSAASKPSISGSRSPTPPSAGPTPAISGGGVLAPNIAGSKKDEDE